MPSIQCTQLEKGKCIWAPRPYSVYIFTVTGSGQSCPSTRLVFGLEQAERLRALLHRSPRDFGKPTSVWTLALAAEVSVAEGIVQTRVSGETIRQTLRRLGIGWERAKHWITSPDPAYVRKKGRVTA